MGKVWDTKHSLKNSDQVWVFCTLIRDGGPILVDVYKKPYVDIPSYQRRGSKWVNNKYIHT